MPAVLTFAPIRGATEDEQQCYEALEFQPTCPVRGTTRRTSRFSSSLIGFQSTRPVRGATQYTDGKIAQMEFQSTRPLRGATRRALHIRAHPHISIHAPLTGRDSFRCRASPDHAQFQSTRPLRGATVCHGPAPRKSCHFNPRAPYGARPQRGSRRRSHSRYFNPRAPYGARHPARTPTIAHT